MSCLHATSKIGQPFKVYALHYNESIPLFLTMHNKLDGLVVTLLTLDQSSSNGVKIIRWKLQLFVILFDSYHTWCNVYVLHQNVRNCRLILIENNYCIITNWTTLIKVKIPYERSTFKRGRIENKIERYLDLKSVSTNAVFPLQETFPPSPFSSLEVMLDTKKGEESKERLIWWVLNLTESSWQNRKGLFI